MKFFGVCVWFLSVLGDYVAILGVFLVFSPVFNLFSISGRTYPALSKLGSRFML